jgi:HK97 family phage prohead protease
MIAKNTENHNGNLTHFEKSGFFQGYASVFHVVDYAGDVILPGAFWKAGEGPVKLLWQHDHKAPIGTIERMYEDEVGLFVEGRIYLALAKGREAHILIQTQVLNSMSIGYDVVDYYYKGDVRCITRLNLWEVSIVTFPANKFAEITSVGLLN